MTSFADLGLAKPILTGLHDRSHTVPTPIQAQAIQPILKGKDILGIAQTGTGKTGAFALPILSTLSTHPGRPQKNRPRVLVMAPTRELAIQIAEEFRAYGKHIPMRLTMVFGGINQRKQVDGLRRGVDIVVATPGRLVDLMNQGHIDLGAVEHFVLDEADRMFDMGFARDLERITASLSKDRQSLLFSATMPSPVVTLADGLLIEPTRIEVTPQATPVERINQILHHLEKADKPAKLKEILEDETLQRVIVFTKTKHGADKVTRRLSQAGIEVGAIHGDKSQNARQTVLKKFRSGRLRVLVATDIAARGIDVANVTHVINYELPIEPENYVHRIGRTARAGANGAAISLCDPEEISRLRAIEKMIGLSIPFTGEPPAKRPVNRRSNNRKPHPRRHAASDQASQKQKPANQNKRRRHPKKKAA